MNWLFIVVLALLAVYMYMGYRKGMVMIIMSFVALAVSIVLTSAAAPALSRYVMNNTDLYETLYESTCNSLQSNNTVSDAIASAGQQVGAGSGGSFADDEFESRLDEFIESVVSLMPIPESLQESILSVTGDETALQNIGTGDINTQIEAVITDLVAARVAEMIISSGCYIVVFAIVYAAIYIIFRIVNGICRLPVIKELNKGLGIIFGLLKGILVVWLFFIAVTVFYNTAPAQSIIACINENTFLTWLYDNNIIMNILISAVTK